MKLKSDWKATEGLAPRCLLFRTCYIKKASHCVTICNSPTTNRLDLIIPRCKHTEMGLSVQTFSLFTKWNFWPVQQIVQSSKIPQRSIPKRKHTLRNRFHGETNSVRKSFHADLRRGIFHWRNFENEKKVINMTQTNQRGNEKWNRKSNYRSINDFFHFHAVEYT